MPKANNMMYEKNLQTHREALPIYQYFVVYLQHLDYNTSHLLKY